MAPNVSFPHCHPWQYAAIHTQPSSPSSSSPPSLSPLSPTSTTAPPCICVPVTPQALTSAAQRHSTPDPADAELCYNIELSSPLTPKEAETLQWLLRETFEPEGLSSAPFLTHASAAPVVEVGPRLSFSTAWATNALSICQQVGLSKVTRVEASRRYAVAGLPEASREAFAAMVHDRMTEQVYLEPLHSFKVDMKPDPVVRAVPVPRRPHGCTAMSPRVRHDCSAMLPRSHGSVGRASYA